MAPLVSKRPGRLTLCQRRYVATLRGGAAACRPKRVSLAKRGPVCRRNNAPVVEGEGDCPDFGSLWPPGAVRPRAPRRSVTQIRSGSCRRGRLGAGGAGRPSRSRRSPGVAVAGGPALGVIVPGQMRGRPAQGPVSCPSCLAGLRVWRFSAFRFPPAPEAVVEGLLPIPRRRPGVRRSSTSVAGRSQGPRSGAAFGDRLSPEAPPRSHPAGLLPERLGQDADPSSQSSVSRGRRQPNPGSPKSTRSLEVAAVGCCG